MPVPTLDTFLARVTPLAQEGAVGLSLLLVAFMLVFSDWRFALAAFALVHVLVGILLTRLLPPEWALLPWIVGGLVGVMWFLSARRVESIQRKQEKRPWWLPRWRLNASTLMRLALVLLLLVVVYSQRPVVALPDLDPDLAQLATFLALAGLVGLGLGDRPMRWGFGLSLWVLTAHFAVPALRTDVNTVALLAGLELLLGFAISYLIVVDGARFWPYPEDA